MSAMTEPLASVVIPVYNGERFLGDALESVFDQDYERIEIVVIDDGSQDRTNEIVRGFPGARYVRQRNQGPAAARNTGIALSSGEVVSFLDADDVMLRHRISSQVSVLLRETSTGCVLARQRLFTEPGQPMPTGIPRDPVFDDLGGVQPQSAMVRRSVLDGVGRFDPAYRVGEGIEWLSRLRGAAVGIAVVDEVLTLKRVHPGNHDTKQFEPALLRMIREHIRRESPVEVSR